MMKSFNFKKFLSAFTLITFIITILSSFTSVYASKIDELEEKIDEHREAIETLNKEIAEQEKKVLEVSQQKQTLQTAIQVLDTSKSKVETSLYRTENQIDAAELTIEMLNIEINNKSEQIEENKLVLANAIRGMVKEETNSFIEIFLNNNNLSDAWNDVENLEKLQNSLKKELVTLQDLKYQLLETKSEKEGTKIELEEYKKDLSGQRQVILSTKQEKDKLLAVTKNQEENYRKLLEEKVRQREIFEQELLNFESQLQIYIDPNSFPEEGSRVLSWPLDNIKITQLFGTTLFSQKNPSVYGGRPFHPGVDFGTPIGTKVLAVRQGTIWKTGNTDSVPGCYSWGKWVLIKHDNGLSSLYAHLSAINVSEGQVVSKGDSIGFTGNTGYSTGPHLHLGLYATQGVKIVPFNEVNPNTRCGGTYTPAADPDAYLDPQSYLPLFEQSMLYL